MHCTKQVTPDVTWIGANDRRLAMFEGVYSVPRGVAYNSYLIRDEKTAIIDTVDKAVSNVFSENVAHALGGRRLDYVVVQHMEPDHSATLRELLLTYPEAVVVCNAKTEVLIRQYFDESLAARAQIVKEGDTLALGRHTLTFLFAPMVHWPEVMVTYDAAEKALFSADAFGTFGALNGAIFADEVDFARDYLDETRRYYTNIVGKYGVQVQSLLKKASAHEIRLICPLHGFVWRENLELILEKYGKWSTYTPEERGVMIAYASIYGNTENAAEALACRLRDRGARVAMFDVSVTPASEIIAEAFRWDKLVFASPTYNAGVFVSMDALLRDIAAHNLQNRTAAFIENGSWAPLAGKQMREILSPLKGMTFLDETITVFSALKAGQEEQLNALADALANA
ncbi:MAG: FprA family A-type flavoprotein [Oscillospiraceae bacterium]|jgi:flavorubredoxin|nr:FprA family A-type flavoprotein [Oscillospiraceae bacterium]